MSFYKKFENHSDETTKQESPYPFSEDTGIEINETEPLNSENAEFEETQKAKTKATAASNYIRSMLFGGLDGVTTVFVSVATIYSSEVGMIAVLVIGLAKLLSGALSMGVGDYVSSKAEVDLIKTEREREMWECENFLYGEMEEMINLYEKKGLDRKIAIEMVKIMAKNRKAFVDIMMVHELGLKPAYDPYGPIKNGLVNFGSFLLFGSIPLILYFILAIIGFFTKFSNTLKHILFGVDCIITLLTLIGMGYFKSRFSDQKWWISIFATVIIGSIAALSGYLTSLILEVIVDSLKG